MNQKIKEILEKHIDIDQLLPDFYHEDLNNAIIEICEEQKEECADYVSGYVAPNITNGTKNIAQ